MCRSLTLHLMRLQVSSVLAHLKSTFSCRRADELHSTRNVAVIEDFVLPSTGKSRSPFRNDIDSIQLVICFLRASSGPKLILLTHYRQSLLHTHSDRYRSHGSRKTHGRLLHLLLIDWCGSLACRELSRPHAALFAYGTPTVTGLSLG